MALVRELARDALEDGYAAAARDTARPRRFAGRGTVLLIGVGLLGLLLTVAVLQARSSAPQVAEEKQQLIDRIDTATARNDRLQARAGRLREQVSSLQNRLLAGSDTGSELRERLGALGVLAGTSRVRGPGLRIVVDDASPATPGPGGTGSAGSGGQGSGGNSQPGSSGGRILDIDLQHLVNGLWSAGAEAVAINGQRLTAMTAIRGADRSITVDYRPLARPYVISAIGDPKALQARLIESPGGAWMLNLKGGHDVRFDITPKKALTLPADSGVQIRHARTDQTGEGPR